MTRYLFSKGIVQAADETLRRPSGRPHPLRPTILFITTIYTQSGGKVWPRPEKKEQPHEQRG